MRNAEVDGEALQPLSGVHFAEWGAQWLSQLERRKSTVDSYRSTIAYASDAFGDVWMRNVGPTDVAHLSHGLKRRGLSEATTAKHLRVLSACFASAFEHGIVEANPIKRLRPVDRPRSERREAACFSSDELRGLFAELPEGLCETLFMLALKTGLRQSELLGLRWKDVDLAGGCIRVLHSFIGGATDTPEDHGSREVGLPADLVVLLGGWRGECGRPGGAHLVFPGRGRGGQLAPSTLNRRMLYPALRRAGIPRRRPPGENRTFHSLRHTFAKHALESGRPLTWLSHHLGHSSVKVTSDAYGQWDATDPRWEVRQMDGVFGV